MGGWECFEGGCDEQDPETYIFSLTVRRKKVKSYKNERCQCGDKLRRQLVKYQQGGLAKTNQIPGFPLLFTV